MSSSFYKKKTKIDCKLYVYCLFDLKTRERSGFLFDQPGFKLLKSKKQLSNVYENI